MAKEIKADAESGAARFLKGVESMRTVEYRGATGLVNAGRIAELRGQDASGSEGVPRPHEKVKREFVLTRETDEQLESLVRILRQTTTAKLSGSHVLRALLRLLTRHLPQVRAAAVSHGPRRLPSTCRNQTAARVDFDHFLGSILHLALRTAASTPSSEGTPPRDNADPS